MKASATQANHEVGWDTSLLYISTFECKPQYEFPKEEQ